MRSAGRYYSYLNGIVESREQNKTRRRKKEKKERKEKNAVSVRDVVVNVCTCALPVNRSADCGGSVLDTLSLSVHHT